MSGLRPPGNPERTTGLSYSPHGEERLISGHWDLCESIHCTSRRNYILPIPSHLLTLFLSRSLSFSLSFSRSLTPPGLLSSLFGVNTIQKKNLAKENRNQDIRTGCRQDL